MYKVYYIILFCEEQSSLKDELLLTAGFAICILYNYEKYSQ